jgi:UDP-N-acetylmuramate dehydrogenase
MSVLYSDRTAILYSCSLEILSNISLAPFTTFGIGGPASWFVESASEEEIVEATTWARERGVPFFVLGGGSNLLISDAGFNGLVLRVAVRGISCVDAASLPGEPAQRIYQVAAGEDWNNYVERTIQDDCAGLECLTGIPGSAGGTPVQNVGAYGQEVSSVIERVRAYDLNDRNFVEFTAAECGFAYRRSRFNTTDHGRFLVTRVDYHLTPGGAPTLRYADVQRELEAGLPVGTQPTIAQVAAAVRRIRRAKGMLLVDGDPDCRSAGSFFKNPVVSEELFQKIAARITVPQHFPAEPGPGGEARVKIPAAWIIEQAGFPKGYTLGAAAISSRHTLALINRSAATAADILALAQKISDAVQAQFGIRLVMEPVLVGF